MSNIEKPKGLLLLRTPFQSHQISKLPKPTKKQTEEVKADFKKGVRCKECGAWHHPDVVHLDYVGHAALTDRLLECDESWQWQPLALDADGLPKFDKNGGLWIKLTVCGVTRFGYGNTEKDSNNGDAEKEIIGDALRNAAMRFGAALDLWHKGDLHAADEPQDPPLIKEKPPSEPSVAQKNVAGIKEVLREVAAEKPKNPILNHAPSSENSSAGNYVIKFGKHKDKKLCEMEIEEIRGYITWLCDSAKNTGKALGKFQSELVTYGDAYIISQVNGKLNGEDPFLDTSEDVPF